MRPIRKIYQAAPDSIAIPEELRDQPEEIAETDANGWPLDFFAQTFGSIPDLPDRGWQGDYDERETLE
jgi:hypothetical protein